MEETYIKIGIAVIAVILIILLICYFTSSSKSSFYNGSQERSDIEAGTRYQYKTAQEHELCRQIPNACAEHRPAPINDAAQDTKSRGLVPSANQPDHVNNHWKSDASTFTGIPDDSKGDSAEQYYATKGKTVNQKVEDVSTQHIASRFSSEAS